jgi:hypothetical protein
MSSVQSCPVAELPVVVDTGFLQSGAHSFVILLSLFAFLQNTFRVIKTRIRRNVTWIEVKNVCRISIIRPRQ